MATQLKAAEADAGIEIPGEGEVEVQTGERDYEAEAREHGWAPKEEFRGDDTRWVDAETFMKRADEMMPLLKAQNARLKRDLDSIKKDLKRATAHFEGAEKRAYDQARADLERQVEAAVETGDLTAAREAMRSMEKLSPGEQPVKHSREEAQEALDDFREANPWYDRANLAGAQEVEINARLYYDRMIDKHIEKTKEMAPAEFFQFISDMTVEKYPALKGKPARLKPASAVEGSGQGRSPGRGKDWSGLPDDAKKQYQRFIDRGILGVKETGDKDKDLAASRAYYARTHDWEGR